jgi:hypothetical protein
VHSRQITEVLWQQKHVFGPLEFGVTVNFSIILNKFSCALSSYASVTGPTIHWPRGCVCDWSEICRGSCGFIFVKYKLIMWSIFGNVVGCEWILFKNSVNLLSSWTFFSFYNSQCHFPERTITKIICCFNCASIQTACFMVDSISIACRLFTIMLWAKWWKCLGAGNVIYGDHPSTFEFFGMTSSNLFTMLSVVIAQDTQHSVSMLIQNPNLRPSFSFPPMIFCLYDVWSGVVMFQTPSLR